MSKNTAVIYARFSSSSQREESIEDQLRECTKYAQRNDLKVIGNYCDFAISGRTDERPEFQRMIADAKNKLFDKIIVYRLDRFARNRVDSVVYKAQLAKHKVQVVSATETIPEGSDGVLIEALHEALAQKYSDDLSKIIRRGQNGNAENCKSNGPWPFGYKVNPVTRHLEIDEEKAPIVQEVFRIIANGGTYNQALDYLEKLGYKKSKNWMYKLLRNERYTGIYIYKDYYIEGGIPALVSKEMFQQANATRRRNQKRTCTPEARYLLSGKVFCKKCDAQLRGNSGIGKSGKRYRYYACNTRKNDKNCDAGFISAEFLEGKVLAMLFEFIFNEEVCQLAIDYAVKYIENNNPTHTAIASLERKLAETNKKINNIMDAIEAGIITATTKSRLQELEKEKESFQSSILNEKLKAPVLTREQLEYYFNSLRTGEIEDKTFQQYLVDNFVTAVYADMEEVTVAISLGGETEHISWRNVFASRHQWWTISDNDRTKILMYNATLYLVA